MTTPAAVSAALHRHGFRPLPSGTPRTREGVRVQRTVYAPGVAVIVDLDSKAAAARMAADVRSTLDRLGFTTVPVR